MDNPNSPKLGSYNFLEDEAVERSFADINFYLLSGRHLSAEDGRCFSTLDEYKDDFATFYSALYKLKLGRQIQDGTVYYYLHFFDGTKGRLSDSTRQNPLTESETIVGLILIKFYESQMLRMTKIVRWADIRQELTDGEYRDQYRRIFLRDAKGGYTEKTWEDARALWLRTLKNFNRLGWVALSDASEENFRCEIKPSIHRLATMYSDELLHFDEFAERITLNKVDE